MAAGADGWRQGLIAAGPLPALGLLVYAVVRSSQTAFLGGFGVAPEDVGLDEATMVARAVVGFGILSALFVVVAGFDLLVVALVRWSLAGEPTWAQAALVAGVVSVLFGLDHLRGGTHVVPWVVMLGGLPLLWAAVVAWPRVVRALRARAWLVTAVVLGLLPVTMAAAILYGAAYGRALRQSDPLPARWLAVVLVHHPPSVDPVPVPEPNAFPLPAPARRPTFFLLGTARGEHVLYDQRRREVVRVPVGRVILRTPVAD